MPEPAGPGAYFLELVTPDGTRRGVEPQHWDDGSADGFLIRSAFSGTQPTIAMELSIEYTGEDPVERGLRIGLEAPALAEPPGWLIPGLFYGENRPISCRRLFPRYERGAAAAERMGSQAWSFRADRAATPAVFAWQGQGMMAIAVDEVTEIGPSGIGFEGSADRTRIWVDLPFRE